MSDDIRREAADVARALRRKLEREHALGTGELLATGVAKARVRAAGANVAAVEKGTPVEQPTAARRAPADWEAPEPGTFTLTPPPAESHGRHRAAEKTAAAVETEVLDLPAFTDDLYPSALVGGRDQLVVLAEPLLEQVATEARACTKCGLCSTRTNAVPGVGSARTGIVFVGEAPGADEDMRGEPFQPERRASFCLSLCRDFDERVNFSEKPPCWTRTHHPAREAEAGNLQRATHPRQLARALPHRR